VCSRTTRRHRISQLISKQVLTQAGTPSQASACCTHSFWSVPVAILVGTRNEVIRMWVLRPPSNLLL
jgi:hypothetical protein